MPGIRDVNLLDSALKAPFQTFGGKQLYPDIYDKASRLSYSLIENHPFADGNKRIGVHLTLLFLKLNEENLNYTQKELIDFGLGIASGKISKDEIKDWLIKHRNQYCVIHPPRFIKRSPYVKHVSGLSKLLRLI